MKMIGYWRTDAINDLRRWLEKKADNKEILEEHRRHSGTTEKQWTEPCLNESVKGQIRRHGYWTQGTRNGIRLCWYRMTKTTTIRA